MSLQGGKETHAQITVLGVRLKPTVDESKLRSVCDKPSV